MRTAGVVGSILGIGIVVSAFAMSAIHGSISDSPLGFFLFAAWALAPFLFMLVVSLVSKYRVGVVVSVYLCLAACALALMWTIVWYPDAQGALLILFLPLYLTGLFIFSMFVAVVVTDSRENRRKRL